MMILIVIFKFEQENIFFLNIRVWHPKMSVGNTKCAEKITKSTPYVKVHVTQFIYSVWHYKSRCVTQENCHDKQKMCCLLFCIIMTVKIYILGNKLWKIWIFNYWKIASVCDIFEILNWVWSFGRFGSRPNMCFLPRTN